MAKQILPWFGGSAAVWTTCLVFFQSTLLLGYAYADIVDPQARAAHAGAPARRAAAGEPRVAADRAGRVLEAGRRREPDLPHPRHARRHDRPALLPAVDDEPAGAGVVRAPLSRAQSVPAVRAVEPRFAARAARLSVPARAVGRHAHAGVRLVGWATCSSWCSAAVAAWASRERRDRGAESRDRRACRHARRAPADGRAPGAVVHARRDRLRSCCSRSPTTSRRTSRRCRSCGSCRCRSTSSRSSSASTARAGTGATSSSPCSSAALGVMAWSIADPSVTHDLTIQLAVFCDRAVRRCMFCHGELVRLKPAPRYLTRFYLMVSLGGALGAALSWASSRRWCCPPTSSSTACSCSCALLLLWQARREPAVYPALGGARARLDRRLRDLEHRQLLRHDASSPRATSTACCACRKPATKSTACVASSSTATSCTASSTCATTCKREATSYYSANSGIGRVIELMHPRKDPIKVGVIGLGTGTIAVYGSQGRRLPLLRHQSGRHRNREARLHLPQATATRRSSCRSATRA